MAKLAGSREPFISDSEIAKTSTHRALSRCLINYEIKWADRETEKTFNDLLVVVSLLVRHGLPTPSTCYKMENKKNPIIKSKKGDYRGWGSIVHRIVL